MYSDRHIEVIVLKTWFQKLLVSCFRRKIMYFSFKVSWYILSFVKVWSFKLCAICFTTNINIIWRIMTPSRPYVDQESYKLLANKATLNQGTVDIFFRTFCNIFHHNFQIWSEFRKYILQMSMHLLNFLNTKKILSIFE